MAEPYTCAVSPPAASSSATLSALAPSTLPPVAASPPIVYSSTDVSPFASLPLASSSACSSSLQIAACACLCCLFSSSHTTPTASSPEMGPPMAATYASTAESILALIHRSSFDRSTMLANATALRAPSLVLCSVSARSRRCPHPLALAFLPCTSHCLLPWSLAVGWGGVRLLAIWDLLVSLWHPRSGNCHLCAPGLVACPQRLRDSGI